MKIHVVVLGALLCVAPLFSQPADVSRIPIISDPIIDSGELHWFLLSETPTEIRKMLGAPHVAADFSDDFVSWNYQIDVQDTHEFSHQLVFRKSTGRLISVARNYEDPRVVDALFPEDQTTICYFPDAAQPQYSVLARRLSEGRVLLTMGVSKRGESTTQLLLILESELPHFHRWLVPQLPSPRK